MHALIALDVVFAIVQLWVLRISPAISKLVSAQPTNSVHTKTNVLDVDVRLSWPRITTTAPAAIKNVPTKVKTAHPPATLGAEPNQKYHMQPSMARSPGKPDA